MSERVQPTDYALTITFKASQTPIVRDDLTGRLAAMAAINALGITEALIDEVILTSRPRWRTKP